MTDTRVAALPVEVVIGGAASSTRVAALPVEVVIGGAASSTRVAALPVEVVVMLDGYSPPGPSTSSPQTALFAFH